MKIGVQGFKLPRKQQSDELPSFEVYELGRNATQLKIFTRKLWLPRCKSGNSSRAPTRTQTLHNLWCCERAACYAPSILSLATKGRSAQSGDRGKDRSYCCLKPSFGEDIYPALNHWKSTHMRVRINQRWSKGMMKIQNIIALTAQHRIPFPCPQPPKVW